MACELVEINDSPLANADQIKISAPISAVGKASFRVPLAIPSAANWTKVEIKNPSGTVLFTGAGTRASVEYTGGRPYTTVECDGLAIHLTGETIYGTFTGTLAEVVLDMATAAGYNYSATATGPRSGDAVQHTVPEPQYLEEVLTTLCNEYDAVWRVDIVSGVLELITLDRVSPSASTTISVPFSDCSEADAPTGLRAGIAAPTANRVTVAGINADIGFDDGLLEGAARTSMVQFPIYPNDSNKRFPLMERTTRVTQIEIDERGGFSLSLDPLIGTATDGTSTGLVFDIVVTPIGPWDGPVGLVFEDLSGITASFSAQSIPDGNGGSTLTLTPTGGTWVDEDVSQEGYFRVIATSGDLRAEIRGQVVIEAGGGDPYYEITVAPSTDTIVEAGCVTYTVTVTPFNGYTGTVNLSLAYPLPAGTTHSFTPAAVVITSGAETSTLEICDADVGCDPEYPCDTQTVEFSEENVCTPDGWFCPPSFYSGDVVIETTWTVRLLCGGVPVGSYSGSKTKTVAWNPDSGPNPLCGGWGGTDASITELVSTPYGTFLIFIRADGCVACN